MLRDKEKAAGGHPAASVLLRSNPVTSIKLPDAECKRNVEQALALAELGLAVFPCLAQPEADKIDPKTGEVLKGKGAKSPHTPHGFHDASTDPNVIRSWWKRLPDALVGLRTGRVNGIAVVDLDVKNGSDWRVSMPKVGLDLPKTHTIETRSGGLHKYYRYPTGVEKIPSSANLFKHLAGNNTTGIDTRGDDAYVIAWGDLTKEIIAGLAEWPTDRFADASLRDEEAGWAEYKEKHPAITQAVPANLDEVTRQRYRLFLAFRLADLRGATKPGRNDMLYRAVCKFAPCVGRGLMDAGELKSEFIEACKVNGLVKDNGILDVRRTIAAGLRYKDHPLAVLPERERKVSQNSQISQTQKSKTDDIWGDPEPLLAKLAAWPYPIEAFPAEIQNVIVEAREVIKLPVEIAGNCALSALSISAQALADVKRMSTLTGPISLFLLAVAESGDRKSTCDRWFTAAVLAYQKEQREKFAPELKDYRAAVKAWKAKGRGMKSAIETLAKSGKSTIALENDLSVHAGKEPREPRVPSLIRVGDNSSEQLAFTLANKWPSAGIISAEAGSVFGGHAMGGDKIMRNLALQNVLWDGGSHPVGRRTSECFEVHGARLTIGLQAQESVLREFCNQYGSLARGIGFFARFLFAWPKSMQGERIISTMPPEEPPASRLFNRRLSELINLPVSMDADGALTPILLDMTEDGRDVWVEIANDIERELKPLGDLAEVRDVASKAADNVVRVAALFHIYQHGPTGRIDADTVCAAAKLVTWHLNEARRFLGEFSMAPELAGAARIEEWLVKHCQAKRVNVVLRSALQQHGPHGLRKKKELDASLSELAELNHIRQIKNGSKREIHVNPALLEVEQ